MNKPRSEQQISVIKWNTRSTNCLVDSRPGVMCRFPEWMFLHIKQAAVRDNISFAEQVRRLCEKGLT